MRLIVTNGKTCPAAILRVVRLRVVRLRVVRLRVVRLRAVRLQPAKRFLKFYLTTQKRKLGL